MDFPRITTPPKKCTLFQLPIRQRPDIPPLSSQEKTLPTLPTNIIHPSILTNSPRGRLVFAVHDLAPFLLLTNVVAMWGSIHKSTCY